MQPLKRQNRLAIISFIFGLVALLSVVMYWAIQKLVFPNVTVEFLNRVILPIMDATTTVRNLCALTALTTGIIALIQIKKAAANEKGKLYAWIGIVLGAGWILFGFVVGVIFSVAEFLY